MGVELEFVWVLELALVKVHELAVR
jgi:hypothetical protein